jgi:hypothetical protein
MPSSVMARSVAMTPLVGCTSKARNYTPHRRDWAVRRTTRRRGHRTVQSDKTPASNGASPSDDVGLASAGRNVGLVMTTDWLGHSLTTSITVDAPMPSSVMVSYMAATPAMSVAVFGSHKYTLAYEANSMWPRVTTGSWTERRFKTDNRLVRARR